MGRTPGHDTHEVAGGGHMRIETILDQVVALPTLSPIATRLMNIGSDDDADLGEIIRLIESDPTLTARLLGLCRGADKGLANAVTTVQRAVVMLGLEAVQCAVLSVCVYELLGEENRSEPDGGAGVLLDEPGAGFDRVGFWRCALAVACASELIARRHPNKGVRPDEAFVAGLLHDLGRLVFDLVLPRAYSRVLSVAEKRGVASAQVERELIGLDHYTVGKRLSEHWDLPSAIGEVMWLHSQPRRAMPETEHAELIHVVSVARAVCRGLHLGFAGDFDPPGDFTAVCGEFGLDAKAVSRIIPDLHLALAERSKLLGLEDRTSPELLLSSIASANHRLAMVNAELERKNRVSVARGRTLAAIDAFQSDCASAHGWNDMLGAVARSARSVHHDGVFAVAYRLGPRSPWRVALFDDDARVRDNLALEPVAEDGALARAIDALTRGSRMSVGSVAAGEWIAPALSGASPLNEPHLTGLTRGAGVTAVLIHEGVLGGAQMRVEALEPLVRCWGAAVTSAAQREAARRLGEQLAQTNRELVETQSQLAESRAKARLGEITKGAAHEMNNPLTVISGRAQMLLRRLASPEDKTAAELIVQACGTLSELVTSLHLLAETPAANPESVGVVDLIADAVALAHRRTGTRDRFRVRLSEDKIRPIQVDRSLMAQALGEVMINAVQAAPTGQVEVRIAFEARHERVVIEVQDHAGGMSPRAERFAFDPFFSERPAGRRTGLGLTRAQCIVEAHGGSIDLHNEPGEGVTARVRVPMRMARADEGGLMPRAA